MSSSSSRSCKSSEKSASHRRLGNEQQDRNAQSALNNYNLALLYAVDGSEDMALAFAARSLVFFQMQAYAACLGDIEQALEYEQFLRAKPIERLKKRQKKASELLEEQISAGTYEQIPLRQKVPDLYLGAHKQIPTFSSALTLEYSPEKGRRLVATTDIPPGSVLCTEKPYASVLFEHFKEDHCEQCHSPLPLNYVVYKLCSHNERFCSEQCRDLSFATCHWFECAHQLSIKEKIQKTQLPLRVLLNTKLPLLVSPDMDGLEGVYGTDEHPAQADDEPFKWLASFPQEAVKISDLQLGDSPQTLCLSDDLFKDATFTQLCKRDLPNLSDKGVARLLSSWLGRFKRLVQMKEKGVDKWPLNNRGQLDVDMDCTVQDAMGYIAAGLYPTYCMFAHSCVPNTSHVFINGNQVVVRASKPIRAGDDVTSSHGPLLILMTKEERQDLTMTDWGMMCECEGCTDPKYERFEWETNAYVCPKCKSDGKGVGCVVLSHVVPTEPEAVCMDCGHVLSAGAAMRLLHFKVAMLTPVHVDQTRALYKQTKQNCHPRNRLQVAVHIQYAELLTQQNKLKRAEQLLMEECLPLCRYLFDGNDSLDVALLYEQLYCMFKHDAAKANTYRHLADNIYHVLFGVNK